jgi:nucleoredoxin
MRQSGRMNVRGPFLRCVLLAGAMLATAPLALALPPEVTLKAAAKMELMRDERVTGSVMLKAGDKLELVAVTATHALVRYRSMSGRVPLASTDLPGAASAEAPAPAPAVAVAATPEPAAPRAPVSPPPAVARGGRIERALAGKLVRLQGGKVNPTAGDPLAGVKFYALYFSAAWCGPCRQFTPSLVSAYPKLKAEYPELEVVFMSADHSASDMASYMKDDKMPWLALNYSAVKSSALRQYAGDGIPCLVLVGADGQVLSDSYRGDNYVGPNAVVKDTWRILADYRKKNPKPKA